tara:strand:- start:80530 stop:80676 length:147 start_codon:yes stop_codon:yes gene_type:complete
LKGGAEMRRLLRLVPIFFKKIDPEFLKIPTARQSNLGLTSASVFNGTP